MINKTYFQKDLYHAKKWLSANPKESAYVHSSLKKAISHISYIKNSNPDITYEDVKKILFEEIDSYSLTVFENSYNFPDYMEYICCQYLQKNPKKYEEISKKIKYSDYDFEVLNYENCTSFDDFLSLYVYHLKKQLFDFVFGNSFPHTKENFINFDELLEKNKKQACSILFNASFNFPIASETICSEQLSKSQKKNKLREYAKAFGVPAGQKQFLAFSNVFLDGSFSYLSEDKYNLEKSLRKDLAHSTSELILKLDSLRTITFLYDFLRCSNV